MVRSEPSPSPCRQTHNRGRYRPGCLCCISRSPLPAPAGRWATSHSRHCPTGTSPRCCPRRPFHRALRGLARCHGPFGRPSRRKSPCGLPRVFVRRQKAHPNRERHSRSGSRPSYPPGLRVSATQRTDAGQPAACGDARALRDSRPSTFRDNVRYLQQTRAEESAALCNTDGRRTAYRPLQIV